MADVIGPFQGAYRFLSNFWPAEVTFDDITYPTVEHAYQVAKTVNKLERFAVCWAPDLLSPSGYRQTTPGEAKRAGRRVRLRPDWEAVKLSVMEDLLRQKFSRQPLRDMLLLTLPRDLVELNTWNDTFWGVCNGKGENHLGRLLMKIREECCKAVRAG